RSSCFDESSSAKLLTPVMLPPGCARLFTSPKPTGSAPVPITIGIVLVAFWTAKLAARGPETMTLGLRRTNSFAKSGSRSMTPFLPKPLPKCLISLESGVSLGSASRAGRIRACSLYRSQPCGGTDIEDRDHATQAFAFRAALSERKSYLHHCAETRRLQLL